MLSTVSVDVAQEVPRMARPRAETRTRLFMVEVGLADLGDEAPNLTMKSAYLRWIRVLPNRYGARPNSATFYRSLSGAAGPASWRSWVWLSTAEKSHRELSWSWDWWRSMKDSRSGERSLFLL